MMYGDLSVALWPVRTIEAAIAGLPGATGATAGQLRARVRVALGRLPAGAIDDATAERWKAQLPAVLHGELLADLDRARSRPTFSPGQGYLLSVVDGSGCVVDATLDRLGKHEPPFSAFWPDGARPTASVRDAALDAHLRAQACLEFPVADPLIGWHRLQLRLPGTYELSDRSGCAALALLMLSSWLGNSLDPTIAVIGDLAVDGSLWLPPDAGRTVRAKAATVKVERACIRRLLVPRELGWKDAHLEVEEISNLAELARRAGLDLAASPPVPLELHGWLQAIAQCDSMALLRTGTVEALRGRLEQLERAYSQVAGPAITTRPTTAVVTARIRLLTRLCEYRNHAAQTEAAFEAHQSLDGVLRAHGREVPRAHVASARNVEASLLIDLHRFDTATELIAEAATAAEAACDRVERARIESTRGRIAAHAGRAAEALESFDQALRWFTDAAPWEANIARTYRIDVLARLGRFADAWAALDEARALNAPDGAVPVGWRHDNDIYLAYAGMKLALLTDDPTRGLGAGERALELAREARWSPWPALGILSRAVELAGRRNDRDTARRHRIELEKIAASAPTGIAVIARGRAAAATTLLALSDGRDVDAPTLAPVRAWLRWLPDGESSPLRAPRDRAAAALDRGQLSELTEPLQALLRQDVY